MLQVRHGISSIAYCVRGTANIVRRQTLLPLRQHSAIRFHSVSILTCGGCPSLRHPLRWSRRPHLHRFHPGVPLLPNSSAPQLAWPVAAIELDKLDLDFDPQRSTFDSPTPSVVVGSDRGHPPESESAVDIQNVPPGRPANEMAIAREAEPEVVTREPRSSRVALAVALPTVAVIAIGILAYYVYSDSVPLGERKGAQVVSGPPVDVNAGGPPAPPSPIGVAASSAPSGSVGAGSVAATGTAIPAPSVEPSTAVTSSPLSQDTAAANGPNRPASQPPSPNTPHRQASTSDQVSPSGVLAATADGAVKKPGDRAMPATGNEVTAKHSAPNRPTRTYSAATADGPMQLPLRDGRANVRPDVQRPRTCTEGVAALGLCSPNSGGENK